MLLEMNIKLKKNQIKNHIEIYSIKDERIQNVIINNYNEDNEEEEFDEEEREILERIKEEELNGEIMHIL